MKCRIVRHFIRVFTVCQSAPFLFSGLQRVNLLICDDIMCEKQCLQGRPLVRNPHTHTFRMLNLGCGQFFRNPFFSGFWGHKWGCRLCILVDYTRLYTVLPRSLTDGIMLRHGNYSPPYKVNLPSFSELCSMVGGMDFALLTAVF